MHSNILDELLGTGYDLLSGIIEIAIWIFSPYYWYNNFIYFLIVGIMYQRLGKLLIW